MSYGKVISGGAKMSKGLSKGINDKLTTFAAGNKRSEGIAVQVRDIYKVNTLSDQHTQDINGGKFKKGFRPAKV